MAATTGGGVDFVPEATQMTAEVSSDETASSRDENPLHGRHVPPGCNSGRSAGTVHSITLTGRRFTSTKIRPM